jgi:hypothetical protein
MLCLVDDQDAAAANRDQRHEELVQRADEIVLGGSADAAAADGLSRHDAKVEEDLAQQFFNRQERIEEQRREARHVQPLEHRTAHRGLAGPDVTRQDDDAFFAADGLQQQLQGGIVRGTQIQKTRIRRQRERRLDEPVKVFVLGSLA